jgi:hypothetical protein
MAGVLIGYLIMAGTNPLGIVFALYKIMRNGIHVLDDDPNYLWGVVHPVYSMIRYNDVGGLYGPLLNFFLNITSRPVALCALLLAALCFYRALSSKRLASWIWLGLAFALTTALSPIIGMAAGGAFGVGLVLTWLWGHSSPEAREPQVNLKIILAAGIAIAAGVLIASPTYYHLITGPSSSHAQFWLFSAAGLRHLLTVLLSIFPVAALAFYGLRNAPRDRRQFLAILFLSSLALLALSVTFSLPAGNQSNMFHAAAVLLAVPAAGVVFRREPSGDSYAFSNGRAVMIYVIFLPTLLTLIAAYVYRPALPASFESVHLARVPQDSDLAALYDWARNETEPDAVFIIDPRDRFAFCGNTAEFPAMTSRVIFTEHFRHYIVEPYPDSRMRFDMAVRLISGGPPDALDRAYLSELNRPVYLMIYNSDILNLTDRMQPVYGPPVFRNGDGAVFKLQH